MQKTARMCATLSVKKWTMSLLHKEVYCAKSSQNVCYHVHEKMDHVFAVLRGVLCVELLRMCTTVRKCTTFLLHQDVHCV